jgi:hypothetical protein
MPATNPTASTFTLTLTAEEKEKLLAFLEREVRDKQVEVHRTDAIDYKEYVQHEADLLQGLIARLRRL